MKILSEKVLRNGEIVTRWFYVYFDSETGKKHKRICKDCYTEIEAKHFVARLQILNNNQYLIKNINLGLAPTDASTIQMIQYYPDTPSIIND